MNYGWSQREGIFATGYAYGLTGEDQDIYPAAPGCGAYTNPVAQLEHPSGALAAMGSGFAYRGTAVPALYGMYILEDIVSGGAYYFDPAAAPACGQAPLHSLGFTIDGAQVQLDQQFGYDNYYSHRVDARLSEDGNGDLYVRLKSTGAVFRIEQASVPEPVTLALLATLVPLGMVLQRRGPG